VIYHLCHTHPLCKWDVTYTPRVVYGILRHARIALFDYSDSIKNSIDSIILLIDYFAKSFNDIDYFQILLVDIDIDIDYFQNHLVDINVDYFQNVFIDIVYFKNLLINIDINIKYF